MNRGQRLILSPAQCLFRLRFLFVVLAAGLLSSPKGTAANLTSSPTTEQCRNLARNSSSMYQELPADTQKLIIEYIRANAQLQILSLMKSGISEVQGHHISEIDQKISQVKIEIRPEVFFPNAADQFDFRESAFWCSDNQTVYLSAKHFITNQTFKKEITSILLLHEVFGLIGIQDNLFSVSSLIFGYNRALNFRVEKRYRGLLPSNFQYIKDRIAKRDQVMDQLIILAGGGVSSIGGGGDLRLLQLKTMFVEYAIQIVDLERDEELLSYPTLLDMISVLKFAMVKDAPPGTMHNVSKPDDNFANYAVSEHVLTSAHASRTVDMVEQYIETALRLTRK